MTLNLSQLSQYWIYLCTTRLCARLSFEPRREHTNCKKELACLVKGRLATGQWHLIVFSFSCATYSGMTTLGRSAPKDNVWERAVQFTLYLSIVGTNTLHWSHLDLPCHCKRIMLLVHINFKALIQNMIE